MVRDCTYHQIERAIYHLGRLHQIVEGKSRDEKYTDKLIRCYQKYLSPLKNSKCPYIPTCSQYGLEAIEKYGAFKGSLLAAWRILRCNPFSKGGFDPVP